MTVWRGRRRLALYLCAALTPTAAVLAQTTAQPPAAPYVDREIEGLAPETSAIESAPYDAEGLPRFLRLETRLGTQPFDDQRRARLGFAAFALVETPNHGTLSLDGSVSPKEGRGSLTLRQRGMPWDGGWLANHELGVINTPAPDITRRPSRVFVPSSLVQGVGAEWNNAGRGLQLQAATGTPGRLEGLPTSAFKSLSGQRSSLGGQWQLGGDNADSNAAERLGWTAALRAESARDVSLLDNPLTAADREDADAAQLALRYAAPGLRVQGQVVHNASSRVNGGRSGYWVDGEWDEGPRRHGLGLFRLEPELSWAGQPLPSDISGAYARTAWRTRQWSAEASLDWLSSISGRAADGSYATASARWRLARNSSLGSGFSLRRFDGEAWDAYGDWRFASGWGPSGLRLEFGGGQSVASRQQLLYDQDWTVPQGFSLNTSLGLGRLGRDPVTGEAPQNLWSAALSLSAPMGDSTLLRGTLNTEQGSGSSSRWGLNLGFNWRINTRWSLEANLNRSEGKSLVATSLDPLATPLPTVNSNSDRSFYAVLRYELQAGSRNTPLGGSALDGGGRIEGVVYFDANKSGTQEASETGVPGVTVFLDNRYGVRTDAQGRFEFPFVASGPRTVSVRNETLPLPWAVVDEGQAKVDVRLRETTRLSLPVQRAD
ncbi:SdrD B-like domain-containing protein [Hydrogenophaga sp.]|uniref:SdrD B-like domain-containing protein n=1 Tax=Hydrogenophaga sp. TaxID=1904254 RepID=UPI0025B8C9AB|nr:SdrD B-like domain-containing protein [Hydrogenophaga sp.]